MHKMGPRGPKHYIFGNHFCSKDARKLRFYVFLHVNARKHDIIILPEVDQIRKKLWIWPFQCSLGPWRSTIGTKFTGGIHGIWASWNYSSKSHCQKYTVWVPGTQHQAVFAMWCLFLKKHTKFLSQTVTFKCFPCYTVH